MTESSESVEAQSEPGQKPGIVKAFITDRFLHDVLITAFVYSIVRLLLFPSIPAMGRPLQLPMEAYYSSSIVLQALKNPAFLLLAGSGVLALALDQIPFKGNAFFGRVDWLEFPPRTGLILMGVCLPMMWKFTTYDVNLLLGQVHAVDRLLVFGLWLAMGRNPAFAPIWLAVTAVVAEQFKYPGCMHSTWADKAIVFYVPLLLWVTFVVGKLRRLSIWVFPALLLCHWASFYVYPAFTKILMASDPLVWVTENRVHWLFVGSYANGWLADWPQERVLQIAAMIRTFDVPIQAFTLVVELSPLLILLNRRLAALMLLSQIGMHLGIYASSGIFFWEWMVPELVLIWALLGPWSKEPVADLFKAPRRMTSVLLIAFALPVFWPYLLGWFDTPYNITYEIEVEDASGLRYQLHREYMDPYHVQHTQGRFYYLDDRVTLPTATYGATADETLFRALSSVQTPDDIRALVPEHGTNRFDPVQTEQYIAFLQTYFARLNDADGNKRVVPGFLMGPHHQHVMGGARPEGEWSDIVRVRIYSRDSFYDGERLHVMQDSEILVVEIPDDVPEWPDIEVEH